MNCRNRWVALVFVAVLSAPWLLGCTGNQKGPWANSVTVVCEAPGMTSLEVEALVTMPIERAVQGVPGVLRIGSVSRDGRSITWLEVDRGTPLARVRQLVAERIDKLELPTDTRVSVASPSPGETLLVVLHSKAAPKTSAARNELDAELRDLAEFSLRDQLLAVSGVSQVTVTGGMRRQYQVVVSPKRLKAADITLAELARTLGQADTTADGPVRVDQPEVFVRSVGQTQSLEGIGDIIIKHPDDRPIRVKDVAEVRIDFIADRDDDHAVGLPQPAPVGPGVIMAIHLQPDAKKTAASRKIDEVLQQFQQVLPNGAKVERKIGPQFAPLVRQAIRMQQRDLPPDIQCVRRSSDRLGDFVVASSGDRIVVKLFGSELDVLRRRTDEIRRCMRNVPGVVDLQVESEILVQRLDVSIRRDAARHGVSAAELNETINTAIHEQVVSQVHSGNRTCELVIKTDQSSVDVRRFQDTRIRTELGEVIPLIGLVDICSDLGPRDIYREKLRRVMHISCGVKGRERSDVESDIKKAVAPINASLHDGYDIEYGSR